MNEFNNHILLPFLSSADSFSERPAFFINRTYCSYFDLLQMISKIRKELLHIDGNKLFGLVVNDDIQTYASIIALWLEGHAYVPLHPFQPVSRNLEIVEQARITQILDSSTVSVYSLFDTISTFNLPWCNLILEPKLVDDNLLAYILFTSGSTGKPKGVQISRKNIASFIAAFWETGIRIGESDRCLQCFDLTFDVSIQSFLTPLLKGACVYTIPHQEIKYSYTAELLENYDITFGAMPPSLIRLLKPYFAEIYLPNFKCNILTAEASPLDLISDWSNCIPNAVIYNFYGPTEATIYCSFNIFNRLDANKSVNGMFCVGKLMDRVYGIVVDDNNKILADGIQGELAIAGDQITPGYWENIEKNNQVFFLKEIDGIEMKFYKTGDSCYFDSDGDIMLFGRLDSQVKIQGYRIELGEIEFQARHVLNGKNAIAMVYLNSLGLNEIVLFIESETLSEKKILKDFLRDKLPSYMVPSRIEFKSVFPINTSGKVDRVKLKNSLLHE
jgi:amino acid adenylation domain-containing protein